MEKIKLWNNQSVSFARKIMHQNHFIAIIA